MKENRMAILLMATLMSVGSYAQSVRQSILLGEDHPKDINCQDFSIPAFNGYAQIIIQATKQAGNITLTCTGKQLKTKKIELLSK